MFRFGGKGKREARRGERVFAKSQGEEMRGASGASVLLSSVEEVSFVIAP
jgi:hypothetical protein